MRTHECIVAMHNSFRCTGIGAKFTCRWGNHGRYMTTEQLEYFAVEYFILSDIYNDVVKA